MLINHLDLSNRGILRTLILIQVYLSFRIYQTHAMHTKDVDTYSGLSILQNFSNTSILSTPILIQAYQSFRMFKKHTKNRDNKSINFEP